MLETRPGTSDPGAEPFFNADGDLAGGDQTAMQIDSAALPIMAAVLVAGVTFTP